MPQNITLPFWTVKLRLSTGEELAFPLSDPNAMHLGLTPNALAEKYAHHFQKNQLDKGKILGMLDLLRDGEFRSKKITVPFLKSPDGISYPDFVLEFDGIFQEQAESFWGMIPALGMEALASSEVELLQHLEEVVRIEFSSKKRLQSVFQIIAASWYDGAEVVRSSLQLITWSPSELLEIERNKQLELLPKVAERMVEPQQQAFGREEEIGQLERILKGRFSRNALLLGPSGTGKTALVQELVHRRKQLGILPEIWETTAAVLIKELTTETGWQDNLSLLVKELTLRGDVLFVRNLAELFEVGRYEGNAVSVAEYLRSAIGRGEITLIGECTHEERARIELRSPNFLAFFQTVEVASPRQDVEGIILKKVALLAGQRHVEIEPAAVQEIVRLHRRFSPYSGMPGRPIRFLESLAIGLAGNPIFDINKERNAAGPVITRELVIKSFCEESGMPRFMVDPAIPMDVPALRKSFEANVFGQERAVAAVVDMLATVKTALSRTGKPIASFLFAGPTGVGKTELAKVLATTMFGSRERMLRFDMSEYSNPWSVMRLTGEGYYSEGVLTSAVRRDPFCVLLFDEIEKADPKFLELLLQVLSEGRLSDSRGRVVNFCSAIIVMTTNIGAANLHRNRISWKKEMAEKDVTAHFASAIEQHFRPELYNRMDAIVAFAPLDKLTVRSVVERELDLLRKREGIQFRGVDISMDEAVSEYLAEVGYDARFGARYLQRAIRERLAVPLAEALNQYSFDERLSLHVGVVDDKIDVQVESDPLAFDLLLEQWDKLTLAEKTSQLRRKNMLLLESPLYLRFQSEIDMLEGEKGKSMVKFWKDGDHVKRHAALTTVHTNASDIYEGIQALELEIALACMGQGPFITDFGQRLTEWEAAFFNLQLHLNSIIFPKRDSCRIGIYGAHLHQVLKFYLAICKAKDFEVTSLESVWFREGHQVENAPKEEASKSKEKGTHYLHAGLDIHDAERALFRAEKPDDLLCGVEMSITGPSVWLYFKDEKGFVSLMLEEPMGPTTVAVQVTMTKTKTPDDIHRQSFYQNSKPKRLMAYYGFVDTKFDIQNQLSALENVPLLVKKLDALYEHAVLRAFLDSEVEE